MMQLFLKTCSSSRILACVAYIKDTVVSINLSLLSCALFAGFLCDKKNI